jgi:hypothetical protein
LRSVLIFGQVRGEIQTERAQRAAAGQETPPLEPLAGGKIDIKVGYSFLRRKGSHAQGHVGQTLISRGRVCCGRTSFV